MRALFVRTWKRRSSIQTQEPFNMKLEALHANGSPECNPESWHASLGKRGTWKQFAGLPGVPEAPPNLQAPQKPTSAGTVGNGSAPGRHPCKFVCDTLSRERL
jgi:hypothetical protein